MGKKNQNKALSLADSGLPAMALLPDTEVPAVVIPAVVIPAIVIPAVEGEALAHQVSITAPAFHPPC